MAANHVTLIGNLVDDPELRFTPSGAAVANFRIASTPRTFNKQTNEWEDGDALFANVDRDQQFPLRSRERSAAVGAPVHAPLGNRGAQRALRRLPRREAHPSGEVARLAVRPQLHRRPEPLASGGQLHVLEERAEGDPGRDVADVVEGLGPLRDKHDPQGIPVPLKPPGLAVVP